MSEAYEFTANLWMYETTATPWFFVTLPKTLAARIRFENAGGQKRGFGSVRVKVICGGTMWKTSLFPEKKSSSYVLPIKAEVRHNEKLSQGAPVPLSLVVLNG